MVGHSDCADVGPLAQRRIVEQHYKSVRQPDHCCTRRNTVPTTLAKQTNVALNNEIEELRKELLCRGVHLKLGKNFRTFTDHIAQSSCRSPVHAQFDPSGDMDGAVDAFWIAGFDEDGDLVHTQATHLLDLRSSSVAEHIKRTTPNYFPKKPPVVRSSIRSKSGPKASKLKGMIAYHGEMWLRKDVRDHAVSTILIRLGLLLTIREWNPDAVFGLMDWALATNGFNMRIGYHHSEAMALVWDRQDNGEQHQVWLVYLEREDIDFLRKQCAVEFASFLTHCVGR